jgi:hypothetical protein
MTDSTGANEILQNDKPWRAIILTSEMEMQVHRGTTSTSVVPRLIGQPGDRAFQPLFQLPDVVG